MLSCNARADLGARVALLQSPILPAQGSSSNNQNENANQTDLRKLNSNGLDSRSHSRDDFHVVPNYGCGTTWKSSLPLKIVGELECWSASHDRIAKLREAPYSAASMPDSRAEEIRELLDSVYLAE